VFPPVNGRSRRLAGLAVAASLAALAAAGCGRQQEPDLANGKALFVQKCGSCHQLARANTKGVTGPNLDDAFAQARWDGFGPDSFVGVVRDQIGHPRAGSVMPAKLVTGEDADDVAEYVGSVAAKGGKDQGAVATAGAPKVSK